MIAKREMLAQALDRSGCNRLLHRAGLWNGLLVLNYHRIGEPGDSLFDRGLWSATAETFERQVRYLARNFNVVGLDDLQHPWLRRPSPRERFVMITFDDGYRDNYEAAFPILQSHNVPGVFFLATGYLDRPQVPWWDEIAWMVRSSTQAGLEANPWTISSVSFEPGQHQTAIGRLLRTYKVLPGGETKSYLQFLAEATGSGRCHQALAQDLWMTWEMVREMRAAGMSIGAHTANHPILANLAPDAQDHEIGTSKCRIEEELGEPVVAMSYPVGGPDAFNTITRRAMHRHGLRFGFSYYGGYNRLSDFDPLDIRRVAVETDVSGSAFRSVAALPQVFA